MSALEKFHAAFPCDVNGTDEPPRGWPVLIINAIRELDERLKDMREANDLWSDR